MDAVVDLLRCPMTGQPLERRTAELTTADGGQRYEISAVGIPLFARQVISTSGQIQQSHYDHVQPSYHGSRLEPAVQEYNDFLDRAFTAAVGRHRVGCMAEICCGAGETLDLLAGRVELSVGLDVSESMLRVARARHPAPRHAFIQGDATRMPLADDAFDSVFIRGGIHHVPDREALFREVHRILKPGGRFFFLEPLDDFALWRWLRAAIYRLSPLLDDGTEQPLRHRDTVPLLRRVGLLPERWQTLGAFGFCLFANSDVLVFNRIFNFVPGIRHIVRGAIWLDRIFVHLPGLRGMGIQVVGSARKPEDGRDDGF